jgi:hypothetical protein
MVRVTVLLLIIATVGRLEGLSQDTITSFHTTVAPKTSEDVANPCKYELRILNANKRIRGLFVVFERGPELQHFYEEPEVAAFAREHDLAMLMPMICPATDHGGDIDVDPNHGLGRALLTAMDQLSVAANHPELRTVPLLLLGFSGAGALVGRLVGFAPDRIATAIVSHGGPSPAIESRHHHSSRCCVEDSRTHLSWRERQNSGNGNSLFALLEILAAWRSMVVRHTKRCRPFLQRGRNRTHSFVDEECPR